MSTVIEFPGFSPKRGRTTTVSNEPQEDAANSRADWRSRERIREDIDLHIAAREAYGKAVAWEVAAESQNLPPAKIDEARQRTAQAYEKMHYRGRALMIVMPTEHKARRPPAVSRPVENHAPQPPQICGLREIRWMPERQAMKRGRQRLAAHAKRLRR